MTKRELASQLAEQENITQQEAYARIEQVFTLIADNIQQTDSIKIRGFGSFRLVTHNARTLLHPSTKQKITIPAQTVIAFTIGRALRNKLNKH